MRDFKGEIDGCSDPNTLLQILDALSDVIERLHESQDPRAPRAAHDLELLLRYGEHKLENLLT